MLNGLDIHPEDPSGLRQMNRLLAAEVKSQALLIEKLKHQLAGHNRHRFGSKSENLDQLNLAFTEDEQIAAAAKDQANPAVPASDEKPPRRHSRKPLPDHLDRTEEVLSPGDDCRRCGGSLKKLGDDVTEELEYIPGRFVVNRFIRPRPLGRLLRNRLSGNTWRVRAVKLFAKPRCHPARLNGAAPVRVCWRMCWSANMRTTCHSIARAKSTPARVLIWIARPWLIGLENLLHCWSP